MARKRDHKAEYAARKAKAQAKGYSGVREARRVRKSLAIPRTRKLPSKRVVTRYNPVITAPRGLTAGLRRAAKNWSDKHSHTTRSEYRPDMTDAEVRAYHRAYVEFPQGMSRRKAAREKRRRIRDYIVEYYDVEPDEWAQQYGIVSE